MEQFILTCLQAQLIAAKVNMQQKISQPQKREIIAELKQVTRKNCPIDAKVD
jgi:hypothetical protein